MGGADGSGAGADGAARGVTPLAAFIRALPKTETHLHLEGALPLDLLRRVAPGRFAEGRPPWWEDGYRYADFPSFESVLLEHAVLWYTSPQRYHEAARTVFAGLAEQRVRYVETSFHLPMAIHIGAPPGEIVAAIAAAAPAGMQVRVFAGMLRRDATPGVAALIDRVHTVPGLAGIDLHGVEVWELEPWTRQVWARARAQGLETKAHAGEFGGPGAVREAIEVLGVRRVQHGVRAVEDPAVVALLREAGATCDVCPISNVKLRVTPSMREHPVRALFDAGVRVTLSTDDPFSFGNRLEDEYLALAGELGFTRAELARVARNGFEVALAAEADRRRWLAEWEQAAALP